MVPIPLTRFFEGFCFLFCSKKMKKKKPIKKGLVPVKLLLGIFSFFFAQFCWEYQA